MLNHRQSSKGAEQGQRTASIWTARAAITILPVSRQLMEMQLNNGNTQATLRQDVQYLASDLPHRSSNSERELQAAQYIRGRLADLDEAAAIDTFAAPDSFYRIFSAYYAEFGVVTIVAIWFPHAAFVYGFLVLIAYLLEASGWQIFGRVMPKTESQNVIAKLPCDQPERLLVIVANHDTGLDTPLSRGDLAHGLRTIHHALVACMALVIIACAARALGSFDGLEYPIDRVVAWTATAILVSVACALLYCDVVGEDCRGALANATGVAALIALAERFHHQPLHNTAVWIVSTGSKEGWFNGIRQLLRNESFSKKTTQFLNLDYLGQPNIRYTEAEALLHRFATSPLMTAAAQACAGPYQAQPIVLHGPPTDALVPMAHGMHAMTITSTDKEGLQDFRNTELDTLLQVDWAALEKAVDFAEAVVRKLDHAAAKS